MKTTTSSAPGSAWAPPSGSYYPIIALCGGGFRGMMSAHILANIQTGFDGASPYPGYAGLISQAALLAGTSTGADIAGMLVCQGPGGNMSPGKIVQYFRGQEAPFFQKPRGPQRPFHDPLTDQPEMLADEPNYSIDEIAAGAYQLHTPTGGRTPRLTDFEKNLAFTSFQVGGGGANWGPVLFHNLPLPASPALPNPPNATIVDAVVASSAMPGMLGPYFPGVTGLQPPGTGDGLNGYIDGAFLAHDPTMAAISLAVASGVPLAQIVVLSIGAGLMPTQVPVDTRSWGADQWMGLGPAENYAGISPFLLGGFRSPVLSMALNGTTTMLAPGLAQLLLGDRFCCVSPVLDPPLSEADATLEAQAELIDAVNHDATTRTQILAAIAFVQKYWPLSCGPVPVAEAAATATV